MQQFFLLECQQHSSISKLLFHLPAFVMIISVPNSLKRSHNSFPSSSTVMFLKSSLGGFSSTSLSSSSVATSVDDMDFILLAGGCSTQSLSEALPLNFGDRLGSKFRNTIQRGHILLKKSPCYCGWFESHSLNAQIRPNSSCYISQRMTQLINVPKILKWISVCWHRQSYHL